MISSTQASDFIRETLGAVAPAFFLNAAIETVGATEPAMIAAGYTEANRTLMQALAVTLIAAGAARQVQSQGAPSGASRSFAYRKDDLTRLRRQLQALDTAGLLAEAVGPDPAVQTFFAVV